MKKLFAIIFLVLVAVPAGLAWWLFPEKTDQAAIDALSLRRKAYDAAQQGRLDESAQNFTQYLAARSNDTQATYDYAVLLAQLGRHAESAALLEKLHQLNPAREAAYFKLGVEYVLLKRDDDAAKVFAELQSSGNRDVALAAAEAGSRLKSDLDRAARYKAEEKVYQLAREFKHQEVIDAVAAMQQQWPLSFEMEMQRLYALENLQKYAPALERADALAVTYPKATDLALFRADLLYQLGRKDEAVALWQKVEAENPGTSAAITAQHRLEDVKRADELAAAAAASPQAAPVEPAKPSAEEVIFGMVSKQHYREAVQAINELEKQRALSWDMEMQRLYALQALGEKQQAIELGEQAAKRQPKSVELAMLRSDVLVSAHRWQDASQILKDVKYGNPDTAASREAQRRLDALPPMCNLDKWNWGEMYASGDYHSRYDDVIGSGFIRDGTYVPGARWLQPYAAMRFAVDTQSGTGTRETIVQDNSVSLVAGARVQIFPTEYLFLYGETGYNKDLLGQRRDGDWAWDYQAGIYGFKSFGPGVVLKDITSTTNAAGQVVTNGCPLAPVTWRGDWFADVAGDFSYYHRFHSWLGYGQAHEGFRLAQFGANVALDAYMVENVAWDVRGNYFDNLFEYGPGARLLWTPRRNWQVTLRTEWIEGVYLGRDDLHTRGTASSTYEDFRVSLSVGVTW